MEDDYWERPRMGADERRHQYLSWAAARSRGGQLGFFSQIARLELGLPVDEEPIREAISYVDARFDCSDFAIAGLLRILYRYGSSAALPPSLRQAIETCVLGFKYWWDEPGEDPMCYWTENHQIIFHSDELLAGQLLPNRRFGNSGMTGAQHVEHAIPRIRRWLDLRATFGFSEWLSNCYLDEDLIALVNLRDFAATPDIRVRSEQLVHLLLFELAAHSFRGVFGCTHGRTYAHMIKGARQEPTSSLSKLMLGTGCFNDPSSMSTIALATSSYRCPALIESIAASEAPAIDLRERHGIEIEDAPRYGLSFESLDDGVVFWGMESFVHPLLRELSLRMVDAYRVYNYPEFRDAIAQYQQQLARRGEIPAAETDPQALTEVHIQTYRTPDFLLSCAQDYRAGLAGYQHHIWQATLGIDAVVFTNHPGSNDEVARPNFWAGNGRLPRAAQHQNVVVCLHRVDPTHPFAFSHAYFPRDAFDEVLECGTWTIARKDRGFVALYSQHQPRWISTGDYAGCELRADAPDNAWICELGRGDDFRSFVEGICKSNVECSSTEIRYESPSQGSVRFGWNSPLQINGRDVSLRGYARYDNPFTRAEFGSGRIQLEHQGESLEIDLGPVL